MPPVVDRKKCVNCGTCLEICPLDVFRWSPQRELEVRYGDECWHCRACVMECPRGALTMRYPLSHMMLTMPVRGKEGAK